ncbi:hypothetical protein F66182_8422 [Fusarium sp. NRRL 66182]|nr:hypothetical protein F66182_8422 [Fusarium sp. NRRL 66182]
MPNQDSSCQTSSYTDTPGRDALNSDTLSSGTSSAGDGQDKLLATRDALFPHITDKDFELDGHRENDAEDDPLPCHHRIIYACKHGGLALPLSHFYKQSPIPTSFFIPRGGWIPDKCRACLVQQYVEIWTLEARLSAADPTVWAECGSLRGVSNEELSRYEAFHPECWDDEEADNTATLELLFAKTPSPCYVKGKNPCIGDCVIYWADKEGGKGKEKGKQK